MIARRGAIEKADRVARRSGVAVDGLDLRKRASFSRSWAGFSRSGFFWLGLFREIMVEMFVDLGRN
jgi:hypothetical protein